SPRSMARGLLGPVPGGRPAHRRLYHQSGGLARPDGGGQRPRAARAVSGGQRRGGGGGIRTHGPLRVTRFRDGRTRPGYATPPDRYLTRDYISARGRPATRTAARGVPHVFAFRAVTQRAARPAGPTGPLKPSGRPTGARDATPSHD